MVQRPLPVHVLQDPEVVKDLAHRSARILLALLEEMRIIKTNYPVAQFLYDDNADFIRSVLDGRYSLPSNVFIRNRYYDDSEAMKPYPLLANAWAAFIIATLAVQPADWSTLVAELEYDFVNREVGAGRVKPRP